MEKYVFLFNKFLALLFSKEVWAAIIAAGVLIWGYTYNSNKQLELQRYQIKATAYTAFLNTWTIGLENNDFSQFNQSLINLYIYAPDCVIRQINSSIHFTNTEQPYLSGRNDLTQITLILHNDMSNQLKCNSSQPLKNTDLPMLLGISYQKPQ